MHIHMYYVCIQKVEAIIFLIWIGGFGVYSIIGILDHVDLYKEITREAVFYVKISFMMTSFKF